MTNGIQNKYCLDLVIRCPDLENPANGVVDDGDNLPGTKAMYKCNDGFRLVGASKRLCQRDGTWDGRAPVCKCEQNNF